jgi:hypothetical protein
MHCLRSPDQRRVVSQFERGGATSGLPGRQIEAVRQRNPNDNLRLSGMA